MLLALTTSLLIIVALLLIGSYVKPAVLAKFPIRKIKKLKSITKKQVQLGLAVLFVILVACTGFARKESRETASKPTNDKKTTTSALQVPAEPKPVPTPSGVADYQVMGIKNTGSALRIEIFTTENDNSRLIMLNDVLFDHYKNEIATKEEDKLGQNPAVDKKTQLRKPSALYIDYYNDKTVAVSYIQRVNDPTTSRESKDELSKHYVAMMISSNRLGSRLFRQDPSVVELKKY